MRRFEGSPPKVLPHPPATESNGAKEKTTADDLGADLETPLLSGSHEEAAAVPEQCSSPTADGSSKA